MPKKGFDAIVVLGAGVTHKGNLTRAAKSRMDKALELYRSGIAPRIVISGKGEAVVMRRYALRKGTKAACVLAECRSRDTIGNAFFIRKSFLEPKEWRRIVVVTSLFHLPRARLIFRKVLGKGYVAWFVASRKVLSDAIFRQNVQLEKGMTILAGFLGSLVADGDMDAVESFLKTPLYRAMVRL